MDSQRKEELVLLIMKKEFKEGTTYSLTQLWTGRIVPSPTDRDQLREDIERLRERREGPITLPLGKIAMMWFTKIYLLDEEPGPNESGRRKVGDLAKQIGVTTAEAMELFREVYVDLVREAFRAPNQS